MCTPAFQSADGANAQYKELSFLDNDAMGELPAINQTIICRPLTMVDDIADAMEDNPRKIKKVSMGFDDVSASQVDEMLQSLDDRRFIVRYRYEWEATTFR